MELGQMMTQAADAGRATDTVLAHMTLGEVVIPRQLMEEPEVQQAVQAIFQTYGVDLREFTVGDPANKINPETGYPEFFFRSIRRILKKVAPIALPILGTMIPGVGPIVGGALGGAAGGAVSGGGLKAALTGAALGGLGGGLMGGAGNSLTNNPLTRSLGLNASFGPATPAQVAAAGGSTNAALAGLGRGATTGLANIKGALSGNLGTLARVGTSIYGGMKDDQALEEARNAMLASQGRAESALQPYGEMGLNAQRQLSENLASGFNPGDLTKDPGYQFRLNEGMDKLNASLAAQGLGQSGGAMKALEDYRQNFAANEYQSAYDRWLSQNSQLAGVGGQGLNTAGAIGNIAMEGGNTGAAFTLGQREARNKRIAELLAGLGMGGTT